MPRTANQADDVTLDHGRHAEAVRGLDPRGAGAMDVEQPALGLSQRRCGMRRRRTTRRLTRVKAR